jgi:hypothetical protein
MDHDTETPQARPATNQLTGEWAFRTDPEDRGDEADWADEGWPGAERTVEVPHAWQEAADLTEYTGAAWYRREFESPEIDDGERALLRFGAVDHEATVYVDGDRVGHNEGGYLPFEVDATDALAGGGTHTLAVRVYDPEDLAEIPHGKQGAPWYTRVSGIWQAADLAVVPETRVADARVTPDLDRDAARVEIEAVGPGATDRTARVHVEREGETVAVGECPLTAPGDDAATDAAATGELTVAVSDPDYWTPADPALYDLRVELAGGASEAATDEYADYFGLRSFEVREGRFYLNGEPFRMRGALDQAYYPETHYRPADLGTFREEIQTAKDLGFNTLRKHIKPAHPAFVELADRLGILVWQEPANPDVCTEASKRAVREQLWGMIERDYNRPSVAVWGLYNEEWGIGNPQGDAEEDSLWADAEKQNYVADLYRETRERDPTRVVCDNSGWAHVATDVNDYHEYFPLPDRADAWADRFGEMLDAPGGNYGVDDPDPPAEAAALVVSEFGTWGLPDVESLRERYGGDPPWFDHDWLDGLKDPAGVDGRFADSHLSEAYADLASLAADWQRREVRSVAHQIETMRAEDRVAGYVITEFSDIEWEFNGVLDYTRERKGFHEDFAAVNDDLLVLAEPAERAVRPGETLRADLVVVNDTTEAVDARIEWTFRGEAGTVDVSLEGFGVERLPEAVAVEVPDVESAGPVAADLSVALAGYDVENAAEVTVVPAAVSDVSATIYADGVAVADRLRRLESGVDADADADVDLNVTREPDRADAAVVTDPDATDLPRVVVPDKSGHLPHEDRELAEGPSWNLCASVLSQTLFDDLDAVPGWAFEGLYPYGTLEPGEGEVLVGYAEGWLHGAAGAVVDRGGAVDCALRVLEVGPVADAVLVELLGRVL